MVIIKMSFIVWRHLMVYRGVQLVLPATQERQESRMLSDSSYPPQTTSLSPEMRERVWSLLLSGRSGTEQGWPGKGRGNNSTLDI